MIDSILDYGENVAVISGELNHNEKVSEVLGYVGLFSFCAEAGKYFTEEESPYTAGEDYYRIEAIERFNDELVSWLEVGKVPKQPTIRRMARIAIGRNKVEEG